MAEGHPHRKGFHELMRTTQRAYVERRVDDYLAGFAPEYCSVRLDSDWSEDRAGLREKILDDARRFEILEMSFDVLRDWYAGETGFAHLRYASRLRLRESGQEVPDRRENLIVARHLGGGRWTMIAKIVLRVG
jgi:hypothetical protein